MQNLLKLIVKYSNFLIFIILEVAAFALFLFERPYPHSTVLSSANKVVAYINSLAGGMTSYFSLAADNERLMQENARLYSQNITLQNTLDEYLALADTPSVSLEGWHFLPAKVVDVKTNTMTNYIVINKGSADSVKVGVGVVGSQGVVGVVSAVNSRFSLVTPLIHPKLNMSCRLQSSGSVGFLHWQGQSPHYAYLTDIARHVSVNAGDTVLTSGLTSIFPEGLVAGVVEEVNINDADTYYTIQVKLATDFTSLRYVQVLSNPMASLQDRITPQ